MRRLHFILAMGLVLEFAGCNRGPMRVTVQGKITAKGQPLDGTVIQFIPQSSTQGEGGMGYSDKDGNFTLSGLKAAQGVMPGAYKVRLFRFVHADGTPLPENAMPDDVPGAKETLPERYTTVESTPLKATVPEGGGAVTIDVPVAIKGRAK